MNRYDKNLELIELLKTFMGGDNEDAPVYDKALNDMKHIVELCDKHNVLQPEIFPWAGGDGVQAEWSCNRLYIEIDSSSKGISVYLENRISDDNVNWIEYDSEDVDSVFLLVEWLLRFKRGDDI